MDEIFDKCGQIFKFTNVDEIFDILETGEMVTFRNGASVWKQNGFFCWTHYGSSAVDPTKEALAWLISVIFKNPTEYKINKSRCRYRSWDEI